MSVYAQRNSNITKTWILIFVFISLISTMFYVVGLYYNSPFFAIIGLLVSVGQAFVGYFFGDKIALTQAGAKRIQYEDAPQIVEMIQNLSKIADIPIPKIHISPDKSANAFACGRNPKNASICLNQGILDLLDKNELEGVIAHELSHIKNRDILIMTMTMVLASIASFIADIGFRMSFFGNRGRRENNSPIVMVLYVVTLLLAPFLATLIQLAVSRQREYLADATAVTFTRYPDGLKSALLKLYNNPTPSQHYSTAMNHFYIAPPKKSFGQKIQNAFSTHPSIADRVKALEQM